jgi:hypothetical protein
LPHLTKVQLAIRDGKGPMTDMFLEPPIFDSIKQTVIKNIDLTDHPVISLYMRLTISKSKGMKLFKQFAQDYTTTNEAQNIVLFAHALDELETLGLVKVQHDKIGKQRSF